MMIKDRIQYPGRLLVDTFSISVRCGVLLLLYWRVFKYQGGSINGVNFQIAAWSMFIYFSFMTLRLRDLAKLIMQDIKSGAIDILFAKPIHYLSYRMWWQFGLGLYSFFVVTFLGVLILVFTIGVPGNMLSGFFWATFLITLILAAVLSLLIYSIVGLFAFWIEDIKPLYWIVDKAVMILGGSYLPVALFPKIMYEISIFSPFGASQFITHTVYDSWKADYLKLISIQLFWIAVTAFALALMFRLAYKKVSVNGG
jgi:ABC-2 type transport system permease protein